MFRVMLCIIMAVAATQAWDELSPVLDPAQVGTGSAITYGNGKLWGVFPNSDSDCTYFEYYDPNTPEPEWVYPEEDPADYRLENTAITFQWSYGGAVFVVGDEGGDPTLYWYDLVDSFWNEEDIENFSLGAGASIAYRPSRPYCVFETIPGWLYCLAGNGREFWRYSIPTSGGPEWVDGIYPGEGAIIADQTPLFIWPEVEAAQEYLLTVSLNKGMNDPALKVTANEPRYEVTERLSNGTYYWQTAARQEATIWTLSAVHSFTLQGGWSRLADIPDSVCVYEGAALAYEKDYYSGEECLIALLGGGLHDYYRYVVSQDTWDSLSSTRYPQNVGTALVTDGATQTQGYHVPWAIFGEGSDSLHYHQYPHWNWTPYDTLPLPLGPGASLAYSVESGDRYLYLTIGEDENGNPRNNFYRELLPWYEGDGNQTGSAQPAPAHARLINGSGKVTVEYELNAPARVKATVFDAAGRQIRVLHSGPQPAGVHRLCWDTEASDRRTCSGAYFILLDTGRERLKLKAVVR